MADSQKSLFLISYDIANAKRLGRVHRCLKKQGIPVQYSVFTTELRRGALLRLLAAIKHIIHPREDDVRCYALPGRLAFEVLGKQFFPTGVMLFSATGTNRLLVKSTNG